MRPLAEENLTTPASDESKEPGAEEAGRPLGEVGVGLAFTPVEGRLPVSQALSAQR